jgi:hypothetical protein
MKKLKWYDMGFVKLSVVAFTLMVVKLWPDLLYLEWYYYLIIFILLAIVPIMDFYKK